MKITSFGIAVIEGDTHIGKWVEDSGTLRIAQKMLEPVRQHVKPGSTVVDAGANIGDHSIEYLDWVGPEGYVVAVEPNYDAYKCLCHNLGNRSNIWIGNFGLSDCEQRCDMMRHANAGASYCIDAPQGPVMLCTLDSLNLENVSLIKADIEGFERRMLQGSVVTITKFAPVLLLEVNDGALKRAGSSASALLGYVRALGYRITPMTKIKSWDDPQYDILCIPEFKP